jgi:uncharacterized membrane protein
MSRETPCSRQLPDVVAAFRLLLPLLNLKSNVGAVLGCSLESSSTVGMVFGVGTDCNTDTDVVVETDRAVVDSEHVHRPCTVELVLMAMAVAVAVVVGSPMPLQLELSYLQLKPLNNTPHQKGDDAE